MNYNPTFLDKYGTRLAAFAVAGVIIWIISILLILYYRGKKNREILELKNQQLSVAIEQANVASVAKSQFLSRISHEIRTPLNAIMGISLLARDDMKDSEKLGTDLDKIDYSSKVLLNIINDVLDMSSIENNHMHIAHVPFDFKEVISSLASTYYALCHDKHVDFEVVVVDVTDEVLIGDAMRLTQILNNLLSNAFKFTEPEGQIKMIIKMESKTKDQSVIRFTVQDTGVGIDQDMKNRLFQPFEQASPETALKHGGSGLGLSIVKNLTELMQGNVSVEGELGKGTAFSVILPFDKAKQTKRSSRYLSKYHVLVVDDDHDTLAYLHTLLKRMKITHDVTDSSIQALKIIKDAQGQSHPYDLCLIDWKMPDMDGLKLTRKIREFKNSSQIIIISAYNLNEIEDEAKAAGADMFITKPIFQSTLFNTLRGLTGMPIITPTASFNDYDFSGHRVLLAEDNEINCEVAKALLEKTKLTVDIARDGQQVVEMFTSSLPGTYDVILMDIQMPFMNGYEATKKIRESAHEQAKTIPVVAMTANAFNEDIEKAMECGMNGHVAKPINTRQLYETIASFTEEA